MQVVLVPMLSLLREKPTAKVRDIPSRRRVNLTKKAKRPFKCLFIFIRAEQT
jgi:hypothetical protein